MHWPRADARPARPVRRPQSQPRRRRPSASPLHPPLRGARNPRRVVPNTQVSVFVLYGHWRARVT